MQYIKFGPGLKMRLYYQSEWLYIYMHVKGYLETALLTKGNIEISLKKCLRSGQRTCIFFI